MFVIISLLLKKSKRAHSSLSAAVLHSPRRVNTRHGTHCVCKRRRRQQNPAASRRLRIQQWGRSRGGGRVGVAAGAAEEPHFTQCDPPLDLWTAHDDSLVQQRTGLPDGGLWGHGAQGQL